MQQGEENDLRNLRLRVTYEDESGKTRAEELFYVIAHERIYRIGTKYDGVDKITFGWALLKQNSSQVLPEVLMASERGRSNEEMKENLHNWAYFVAYQHTEAGSEEEKKSNIEDYTSLAKRLEDRVA